MRSLKNILWLTGKELRAIRGDRVMLVLIAYVFTLAVWLVSDAASTEIDHLSVAVIDEDHSQLSARLIDAIQPPLFATPALLGPAEAEAAQRDGREVLVLAIPPDFERDLRAGHDAELMVLVDATAVAQAGNGATFLRQVLAQELARWRAPGADGTALVDVVFRNRFNPNLTSRWFSAVMQLMNNVTILMLILSGASLIREREHGTIEHVLVMPVRPHEIVFSKILASGAVILGASLLSLIVVVQGVMGVPVAGSVALYAAGAAIYVVAVASLGLLMASFTRNMGQFGLLVIPVMVIMILLSGGMTPLESMPEWLQWVLRAISPATHFVIFAQAVLYRGAGLALVWGEMAMMAAMAAVAVAIVLGRFRKILGG
ncbi:ABC transporter permease [Phaeovulum vinaykumarii]|uniref:ABC-2 type transport system permease protein n=1 Tax=Phaeovulum vinaykumarii TaxID=407234 RepID=A0A1N7JVX8_9RHOB|nr:ABC transporter permease [Phaeovulum vinaykumarii]SIS53512.1 ABC-2 type transport system permease protein [Phaeovulum vinaykumarii]SOB91612.1 ABC-2 type transport system permease protein [Phaeovulum vinaykumarii]